MSGIRALTGPSISWSRCSLLTAIDIHQRLSSPGLSHKKLTKCFTPQIFGKIKLHIARAWKQKDKICLQLSSLKMMARLHSTSVFNFYRVPNFNLDHTASAELKKWQDRCSAHFTFTKCLCCKSPLKVRSQVGLNLIHAWSCGGLIYSNAEKIKYWTQETLGNGSSSVNCWARHVFGKQDQP